MDCHLGVLKLGDRVYWECSGSISYGRIVEFGYPVMDVGMCVKVDLLPYKVDRVSRWIPASEVTIEDKWSR